MLKDGTIKLLAEESERERHTHTTHNTRVGSNSVVCVLHNGDKQVFDRRMSGILLLA